jgi:hypothetical protein
MLRSDPLVHLAFSTRVVGDCPQRSACCAGQVFKNVDDGVLRFTSNPVVRFFLGREEEAIQIGG